MKNLAQLKNTTKDICTLSTLVPFYEGPHGIGKTSFVRQLAKEQNKTCFILNLATIEAADFTGLPMIVDGKQRNARPYFFDADILFLDEADRVRDLSVKAALNSLLNDRMIGEHVLRPEQWIIAAGNAKHGEYETIEFDPSLEGRIVRIDFTKFLTIDDRLRFFADQLGETDFVRFLRGKPELFGEFAPRRLFQAAQLSHNLDALSYVLGSETTRLFENFLGSGVTSIKQILSGDYTYLTLSPMSRVSIVSSAIALLESAPETIEKSEVENLNEFLNELPAEEKSIYFSGLRNSLAQGKIDKAQLRELDTKGLFRSQKTFLKELV